MEARLLALQSKTLSPCRSDEHLQFYKNIPMSPKVMTNMVYMVFRRILLVDAATQNTFFKKLY